MVRFEKNVVLITTPTLYEVAERLHYAYPEYDRNITKYTRDMYKKYTGKTGCLDSTYAADIEERREQ